MSRVMIAPAHLARLEGKFLQVLLEAGLEPVYPKKTQQMTEADVLTELPGIPYCLAGSEPYSRRILDQLPGLKVIARCGVGWDAVDVDAANDIGAVVTIAAGTNQEAVAEHTFLLMLALAKNLIYQHDRMTKGNWPRHANLPIRGTTLGIVGLGRIGKAVALKAIAFGMNLFVYEPFPDVEFIQKYKVQLTTLERVMSESDWVTLHVPAKADSFHLINRRLLSMMKPTAFLINTSRGIVVDEPVLIELLQDKRIAGAGLDVFEQEPPRPDNPLLSMPNVVLTAHTAGVDTQSRDDMALAAALAIARIHRGEWPTEWIVNPEVKAKFQLPKNP